MASLWSGHERLRIGERLQASLAGILELDLLRERQRDAVEGALTEGDAPQQEEDRNGLPVVAAKMDWTKSEDSFGTSEHSETNLGAGRADAVDKACLGMKIVTEQLLLPRKKTGINGDNAQEMAEVDSRPSSGFYDTSEMGSLSDSCASMHSDGPSGLPCGSGSITHLPGFRENGFARPHSTDEAAVRLLDLQIQHLTLAANLPDAINRRPVSTGDLEFLLGLGDLSLSFPKNPCLQLLQYKADLVSRNTSEVYHYPSPLHAVALQSPLFTSSLSQSSSQEDFDEPPLEAILDEPPKGVGSRSQEQRTVQLDQYIAKLVLRYKCRSIASRTDSGSLAAYQKSLSMSSVCSSVLGAVQLLAPVPGWKIRRHISTRSHLRSQDPHVVDFSVSTRSNVTNLVKANEPSVLSLPDPLPWCPEPTFVPYPVGSERGLPHWTPSRKASSLPQEKLYRGKHMSRELVKRPERQEKTSERSWPSPRELLNRLSLRRRLSPHAGNLACASSEMNVNATRHASSKGKPVKPKWTSVMEISSRTPPRPQLFRPPPMLAHHLAFSSDSPNSFCFLEGFERSLTATTSSSSLAKVEATSAINLNGDWILQQLGDGWPHTADSTDVPVRRVKLHRSRSFKEFKKAMSRSLRGSRATK
nr:PREDICTED: uncharacterized protein LOC103281597 [Anolis carolinensis]|eukprot:XP_008121710.1 PREDICTED: uncharacterized protein LOC103281597 [Anolis carolinensis]